MPFMSGSITPSTALVAIAASTAEPPRDRISAPACEACTWLLATMPLGEITMDRALVRSCANAKVPKASKRQSRKRCIFHLLRWKGILIGIVGGCQRRMRWGEGGARQECSYKISDGRSPVRDDV